MRWSAILPCALATASLAFAANITVSAGEDPFHVGMFTTMANALSIPAGFFGPGSDPFEGTITFVGNPMPPVLPASNADFQATGFGGINLLGPVPLSPQIPPGPAKIVRRPVGAFLPPDGSVVIPIELVQLNLVSAQPITVTYGPEPTSSWDVMLVLPSPGPGSMTINRNGSTNGGTFTATFAVQPLLIFVEVPIPTSQPLFWNTSDTLYYDGTWNLAETEIPEPGAWMLALTGLALFAARRRRA